MTKMWKEIEVKKPKARKAAGGKMFAAIKVGDQLDIAYNRLPFTFKKRNPDLIGGIKVVTHIWWDPVERRTIVALGHPNADGTVNEPREKWTKTGLARYGYRYAKKDWLAHFKAVHNAPDTVLHIGGRQPPTDN